MEVVLNQFNLIFRLSIECYYNLPKGHFQVILTVLIGVNVKFVHH